MAKFILEFWGDIEVEADSVKEAEELALHKLKECPQDHLFWDVEAVMEEEAA